MKNLLHHFLRTCYAYSVIILNYYCINSACVYIIVVHCTNEKCISYVFIYIRTYTYIYTYVVNLLQCQQEYQQACEYLSLILNFGNVKNCYVVFLYCSPVEYIKALPGS